MKERQEVWFVGTQLNEFFRPQRRLTCVRCSFLLLFSIPLMFGKQKMLPNGGRTSVSPSLGLTRMINNRLAVSKVFLVENEDHIHHPEETNEECYTVNLPPLSAHSSFQQLQHVCFTPNLLKRV